jgi:hypothetical protein
MIDKEKMMNRELMMEIEEAMEKSPNLEGEHMPSGWTKLSEFNGIILAGKKVDKRMQDYQYEFVTWRRGGNSGVGNGNYTADFEGAKKDFAERSGLDPSKSKKIDKSRMFDESELFIIRSGLIKAGTYQDLDHATRKGIGQIVEKIEGMEDEVLNDFICDDEIER